MWRVPGPPAAFPGAFSKGEKMKKFARFVIPAGGLLGFGGSAFAEPPVLTSLTSAIDFSTAQTAVLSAAASLIVVYITWKAAKLVLAAVKSG